MDSMYDIILIHPSGERECLGHMEKRHVTYNRYNEGLLIGAGRLHGSDIQRETFCKHAARFRNLVHLEFRSKTRAFQGTFCVINFVPENHTAVFGSTGPVYEFCPVRGIPLCKGEPLTASAVENAPASAAH